jgi:hypothetical protein
MYDAIVVGARCAGSPTAMLLARAGHRVLLVDRAELPSDTLSTHFIHPSGVARLKRWGLLPRIAAAGAPPIPHYTLDVGPFALRGTPPPIDGVSDAYCLRRTVLDHILAGEAAAAGAEVRLGFPVDGLVTEDGRVTGIRSRDRTERARIVIGADGMNSLVARGVGAEAYDEAGTLTCAYYTYWSGVEMPGAELYVRDGNAVIAAPTNDGLVVTIVFWPNEAFHRVRADVEGAFMAALDLAPGLAARVRAGERADRFRGTGRLPNFRRRPYGGRLGARGRRGVPQGPDPGRRDRRRVPRRRAAGRGDRDRRSGRLRAPPRRAVGGELPADARVRRAAATSAADAGAARVPARPSRGARPLLRHAGRDGHTSTTTGNTIGRRLSRS